MESDHDDVCLLSAVAAILKSNMAAKWLKIRNVACYHWIPYSPQHTFIHNNQVNTAIKPKGNHNCRIQMAAILKSNMEAHC